MTDFYNPVTYIKFTAILIILISFYVIPNANKLKKSQKKFFFWLIVIPIVLSSLYLAGHTVYENITSVTKGPVHWHADYQIWACGERLELHEPGSSLSNKQGNELLHGHEDDRIHIEGTITNLNEVALSKFFEANNGLLTNDQLKIYAEDGLKTYINGDLCPDGQQGYLKVYVNGKLKTNPKDYVISPYPIVPPGDCIIIEFSNFALPTTDKICESYAAKGVTYS